MTNNNNISLNSQDFSFAPDRQKLRNNLNRCTEEEVIALEYIGEQNGRGVTVKEMSSVLRKNQSVTNNILHRLREPEEFGHLDTHLLIAMRGKQGANVYILRENVLLEDIRAVMVSKGYNRQTYQMAFNFQQPVSQKHETFVENMQDTTESVKSVSTSANNNETPETTNTQSNASLNTNTAEKELVKLTELLTVLITQQNAQFMKLEQQMQMLLPENPPA